MLEITATGLNVLRVLEQLSESDVRLLGLIANENCTVEKTVEGLEYLGNQRGQIQRLQRLGYIK